MRRIVAIAAVLIAACTPNTNHVDGPGTDDDDDPQPGITLTSEAFSEGGLIPAAYTCDGQNVSPPLSWTGVPDDAAELVLIIDDPDAPRGTFTHWVVTGIDPATSGFGIGTVPRDAVEGQTSFGTTGYGGPCPPKGDPPHEYHFTLWALGEASGLTDAATAADVQAAAGESSLATGGLTGRYARG